MKTECCNKIEDCYRYNLEAPDIEIYSSVKKEIAEYNPTKNVIFFLLKGRIKVRLGLQDPAILEKGHLFFHPANNKSILESLEDYELFIMRFDVDKIIFCANIPLEDLNIEEEELDPKQKSKLQFLQINDTLQDFIDSGVKLYKKGVICDYFHDLKLKEFLFLMRLTYSDSELQNFFRPILNKDLAFANQILQNIKEIKNVKDLLTMFNYSYSGIEKRFKRIFGISAYQWLQKERAKSIYHEINCSTKTLMTIAYDFGFKSPSHFNDYCKRIFKKPPGQIRKMSKKENMA